MGAIVSLTIAQQKFPPNFAVITNLKKLRTEVAQTQNVKTEYVPEDGISVEDPYEEAKQIHDRQAAAMQALSKSSGFNPESADLGSSAPSAPTQNPNLKVYKAKTESNPSTPPSENKIKY